MILTSLRIPQESADRWLEALADGGRTTELDIPWGLLAGETPGGDLLQKAGLQVMTVRDIIDSHTGRYLEDLHEKTFAQVADAAIKAIGHCRDLGVRQVTLDLGLEHIDLSPDPERLINARVTLLGKICPVAEEKGIIVCAPVRMPPDSPKADGLRVAANLIYEVGLKNFRICLNLFPNDMGGGLDARTLFRKTGSLAVNVRLFYSPCLGEELYGDDVKSLMEALKWHEISGCITLAPEGVSEGRIPAICEQIDELLELIQSKPETS